MKTYFKLKLIKILFLLSILTLFTHFWSPNNSYSCGGSESQCSATKTACDTNCQTSYDAAVQSCHDNWDLDPCLAWYCLTVDDECRAWYTGTCQLNLSNCLNGNLNAYNSCKAACQTNYDACVIPCVTITATAGSNGSISPSGAVKVQPGTNKTFTITPNSCYHVSDVVVDGVSVGARSSYTFYNVTTDHTISASFAITTYTITATAGSGGTITPPSATVTCGSSQCFTITPEPCYHLVDVKVDGVSKGPITSYCFTNVTSNHTISATFSNTYTVNVTKSAANTGTGTVTSTPAGIACGPNSTSCGASFLQDCPSAPSTVTLTAAPVLDPPDSASEFAGWSGACTGTGPCAVTMNGDKKVTATFNIQPPVAAFTASPTTGYVPYLEVQFTNQSVRAWPAWLDAAPYTYEWDFGDGTHDINEIHLKNPRHVYKTIGNYTVTLTVRNPNPRDGEDTTSTVITVLPCPNPPVRIAGATPQYFTTLQAAYNAAVDGDTIQALALNLTENVTADRNISVTLNGGYECGYSTHVGNTLLQGMLTTSAGTLTVGNLELVTGNAEKIYTITATNSLGGTISPAGTVTVAEGGSATFTLTPDPNYFIFDVFVDGNSMGPVATYTFANIAANHTIEAVFATNYTITATAGPNGSISPSGATNVVSHFSQSFATTPNTGYHVADMLVDGVSKGAVSSYTFDDVLANHTISASFAINTYAITATAGLGGSISPSGAVSATYGASQTFTMTPDVGYLILDVLVDGVSVGAVSTYTFTDVTADHTIKAIFSSTLTVTKSGTGSGTITSSPAGINCGTTCTAEYMQGTIITLTATPDAGMIFDGWSGGGCSGTASTCTVTLSADTTVTATFTMGHASIAGVYYHTVQKAYDAAADGAAILVRDMTLPESLLASAPKTVSLVGGYNADYTSGAGVTTLQGTITINAGTVTIKNFVLQK